MDTNDYRFQRLLIEAANYRTIRKIIDADRDYNPGSPTDYEASNDQNGDDRKI